MIKTGSVQTVHLGLEAIADGVVHLAGNQHRAVLEVGSVSFALQGDGEQEATLAGYAACLNSLSFPVQILVRVLPIDLDAYLGELENRARAVPEPLAELARDHVLFLRRLARSRTLLERRFYLVVPAQAPMPAARRGWPFGRRPADLGEDAARRQLTVRCEEVERGLARCGLTVRRLDDADLAQLYHACWCPELARLQRLGRELSDYTAAVVQASPPPTGRS